MENRKIKIVDEGGEYNVYDGGSLEKSCFTYPGAEKFAKKLANQPKIKHEWDITKDSKKEIVPSSGPKWWMWVLMILGTFALMAISI